MIYTYLIGWTKQNKWYYGSRTAKNANPNDLWVSYFTSSRYVKQMRTEYGEPDVIQVRKTFAIKKKALIWEEMVLRRLDAVKSDKWLNRGNAGRKFACNGHTDETKLHMSKVKIGKPKTEEHRKKIGMAHLGMKKPSTSQKFMKTGNPFYGRTHSEEARKEMSRKRTGRKWWTNGITRTLAFDCPGSDFKRGKA